MPFLLEVNSLSISRAHFILAFERTDGDGTEVSRVSFHPLHFLDKFTFLLSLLLLQLTQSGHLISPPPSPFP